MIILAFDSSATTASAALLENGRELASSHVHHQLKHSETLLPMAESLLAFTGRTMDDVELLAVSHGPGSFTGVRIGVSVVKGLAYPKNLPVVGVSTLEALAENITPMYLGNEKESMLICPCMDARRDEFYTALFSFDGRTLRRLNDDTAMPLESVIKSVSGTLPVAFCGDGAEKLYSAAVNEPSVNTVGMPYASVMQNAVSVGKVAWRTYQAENAVTAKELSCKYLRQSQAERNYKEI